MKYLITLLFSILISGCAERKIDILDKQGNIVGGCIAGYDWHIYGLQDSIDYMLYQCAKDSIQKGYSITDMSLLEKDFTLPPAPEGRSWNKKLAMESFKHDKITETKLGYILADIEYNYRKTVTLAKDNLANSKITQAEYDITINTAKFKWLGE